MVHKNIPEKNLKNNDEEKSYNISFKKKRTKSSIRFGAKLLTYLIIAAVSGAFFSRIMIDIKYGNAIKSIEEFASDDMIITDYTKVIDVINPSIVTIGNSSGIYSGESSSNTTGIILDESGNIITSYSLIKDFKEIFVKLSDDSSEPVNAKLVVKSEDIDLAIIKVKTDEELTPVKFAEDNDLFIGQGIAVLGNTEGKDGVDTVSPGIITSIGEDTNVQGRPYQLLQISAPINKKNGGGPICNSKGEVIGLASYNLSQSNKDSGFYYGIQIKDLKILINSTNAFKSVLGVNEGGIIADKNTEYKGFYVQDLDKKGNAYKAGIKPTDIILELDGTPIITVDDATLILRNKKSGETLKCKVLREGIIEEVDVKIN
ncbi:serine protease [Clostridium sp. NSJ-6]|uniref:Serine protease n=1 Tax=Clostridium hominis TaxID=2763036 RepID=A0ABR7DEW9_9CLOT|nr:S1C family serine protease [Clostridium hominis]MBC5629951.1 serine protease [Clostridium hominis]MDU2673896.1 S1C family serine protease [Clostridium sp.]